MNTATYLVVAFALGQTTSDEAALKEVLVPFYTREAAAYEFFLDEKHKQRLELQKQPVLTWTNVDHYIGSVFVWTAGGRPEVIGCIGSQQLPDGKCNVFHEFHALTQEPLPAVKFGDGQKQWAPTKPGVKMAPVAEAPAPADSERLRLTQMRTIAREFGGSMQDNQDVTELRLLTQPLIRYKAPERGVIDGAIFSFVWKGTDPEILLILEDRKTDAGSQWQFALARFNWRVMWATHKDKEVWRVGKTAETENYITGNVNPTTLDAIRAAKAKSGAER